MKFVVEKEIFEKLPTACFGVVVAKGIDNGKSYPTVDALLDESIAAAAAHFEGKKVKEEPEILPYREAFRALGINPNKFMCSIEALFTRIAKGKGMPHINPIVDLGSAISLKYLLPIGAHPLQALDEEVRFAREGDVFRPFGAEKDEQPDVGELIYANGNIVGTRRWIWRQSDISKIERDTTDVFFPIDGFTFLAPRVEAALDELSALCESFFGGKPVARGAVHKESNEMTF